MLQNNVKNVRQCLIKCIKVNEQVHKTLTFFIFGLYCIMQPLNHSTWALSCADLTPHRLECCAVYFTCAAVGPGNRAQASVAVLTISSFSWLFSEFVDLFRTFKSRSVVYFDNKLLKILQEWYSC